MPHLSAKSTDLTSINRHYAACEADQTPYVTCLHRRTKANVEFDHITFDARLDEILDAHGEDIRRRAVAIYRNNQENGGSFMIGAKVISMKDLPIKSAERAAAELYELITEIIRR